VREHADEASSSRLASLTGGAAAEDESTTGPGKKAQLDADAKAMAADGPGVGGGGRGRGSGVKPPKKEKEATWSKEQRPKSQLEASIDGNEEEFGTFF
jgi:hypothetical protein